MLFGTPEFLTVFLPVVLLLHAAGMRYLRNGVLLVASLLFYAWGEGSMVLIMLGSILVNWVLGLAIARDQASAPGAVRAGGIWVVLSVLFNLGLLGLFKYGRWLLVDSVLVQLAERWSPGSQPPIGISFFTFQALSYVIDVYRRDAEPQRSPVRFGLYIALFPQLIAGPIVRYRDIASQLIGRRTSLAGCGAGVRRFTVGLAKKVLLADTLGQIADPVFALDPGQLGAPAAWLGLVAYSLQIYFDFSGYSDMAIGLGQMLGFRFLENFRYPYVARSITDFWRRWHISLSTWFRDYLYIPLGGNRRGPLRTYANLVTVFLLCGLWHGASLGFVVWGLYHGAFLVLERAGGRRLLEGLPRPVQHVYLVLVVMLSWVLFRSPNLEHALAYGEALFAGGGAGAWPPARFLNAAGVWSLAAGIVGVGPWIARLGSRGRGHAAPAMRAATECLEFAAVLLLFAVSFLQLTGAAHTPFIYLRF